MYITPVNEISILYPVHSGFYKCFNLRLRFKLCTAETLALCSEGKTAPSAAQSSVTPTREYREAYAILQETFNRLCPRSSKAAPGQ